MFDTAFTIIQTAVLFLLVLGACYWFTKKLAKTTEGTGRTKYMEVSNRLALGPEKYLSLLKVGKRCFLLSVTKDEVKILRELEEEDLIELSVDNPPRDGHGSFQAILEKVKKTGQKDGDQNGK